MIELILATDLARHMKSVTDFEALIESTKNTGGIQVWIKFTLKEEVYWQHDTGETNAIVRLMTVVVMVTRVMMVMITKIAPDTTNMKNHDFTSFFRFPMKSIEPWWHVSS
jgi:hypothetical protein